MILVLGSTYFSTLKQYVTGDLERVISLQEAEVICFLIIHSTQIRVQKISLLKDQYHPHLVL